MLPSASFGHPPLSQPTEMPPMIPANGAGSHFASCCFSLFFAVFSRDYQRAKRRVPQKSWICGRSGEQKTAENPAVRSLFFAVLVRKNSENHGSRSRNSLRIRSIRPDSRWSNGSGHGGKHEPAQYRVLNY
jgi:hypothetical protein